MEHLSSAKLSLAEPGSKSAWLLARSLNCSFALVARKSCQNQLSWAKAETLSDNVSLVFRNSLLSPLWHQAREGRVKLQTPSSKTENPTTEVDARPCLSFVCISACKSLNLTTFGAAWPTDSTRAALIEFPQQSIPHFRWKESSWCSSYCQGGNKHARSP
jgi:hypothetical protein